MLMDGSVRVDESIRQEAVLSDLLATVLPLFSIAPKTTGGMSEWRHYVVLACIALGSVRKILAHVRLCLVLLSAYSDGCTPKGLAAQ
jgi:hypothetical protein